MMWGDTGEESRRYDPKPSPALSCYTGTGHDGARGSGTRLVLVVAELIITRPLYKDSVERWAEVTLGNCLKDGCQPNAVPCPVSTQYFQAHKKGEGASTSSLPSETLCPSKRYVVGLYIQSFYRDPVSH